MKKMLMGVCLVFVAGLLMQTGVLAKDAASPAKKTRKVKAPKPPLNTGHGETRADRERRLLRECRGKPNAGACEGYAQ